jgi:membrane protein required for colicin V production
VSPLDALLLLSLAVFALRGYGRGFCREGLGLVGLFVGAVAAAGLGPKVAESLVASHFGPAYVALPVAYMAIFAVVWVAATILGMIADRIAAVLFLGGVNRVGGAVLGSAKGAAILGFALLLAARAPGVAGTIEGSRLGRPLMQLAGRVLDSHLFQGRAGQSV